MQGSDRRSDTTEVAAIQEICISIFSQRKDETGRCCAGNVHE
jgi:hypothetical protein